MGGIQQPIGCTACAKGTHKAHRLTLIAANEKAGRVINRRNRSRPCAGITRKRRGTAVGTHIGGTARSAGGLVPGAIGDGSSAGVIGIGAEADFVVGVAGRQQARSGTADPPNPVQVVPLLVLYSHMP